MGVERAPDARVEELAVRSDETLVVEQCVNPLELR